MAKRKTNKALEFEQILKRIADEELEAIHFSGNSAAWKIFNKIRYVKEPTEYVDYVQCKICKVLRTFNPENGTTALKRHKCKKIGENEVVYKIISPEDANEIKNNLLRKSMELCAADMISTGIVSGTGFLKFAQALVDVGDRYGNIDLNGMFPKKHFLTHCIRNLRVDEEPKLKENFEIALKKKYCSISVTSHATIDGNNRFIANSIYFDNELTKLTKKTIFTVQFNEYDNVEKFKSDFINKLKSFGCNEKDFKNISVVTPYKDIFVDTFEETFVRMDCVAFIISSFLKPFADSAEIGEIFCNCKEIASYLIKTGKETKLKFKIVEDMDSWDRKIFMIQKLNINYNEVMKLLSEEKQQTLKFNQNLAEELVKVFEVFIDALDDLQSNSYPTLNKVLLWWSIIKDHFNGTSKYSKPMKRAMFQAKNLFESKFKPTMDHKISCFLDPRFRFLKMLSEQERIDVIRELRCMLDEMPFEPANALSVVNEAPPAKKSKFSHLEANENDIDERDEVNVYIHSTQLSSYNLAESEFNIISNFWKQNESKLPKLFRLATSKLSIPACCCGREKGVNLEKFTDLNAVDDLLFVRDLF